MWRGLAAIVLAVLLAFQIPGAQAQGVPCDSFTRNPDGSWTATSNLRFPPNINLRPGSVMRPGFVILGADVAETLAKSCASVPVQTPQAELTTPANDKGVIDMQTLTCGQLLTVYQEDVDFLMALYSGWSNGLAKNHTLKVQSVKDGTHNVIVYCKGKASKRIVEAIEALRGQAR